MSTSDKQNKPLDLIFFLPHVPWVITLIADILFCLKRKIQNNFYIYTVIH